MARTLRDRARPARRAPRVARLLTLAGAAALAAGIAASAISGPVRDPATDPANRPATERAAAAGSHTVVAADRTVPTLAAPPSLAPRVGRTASAGDPLRIFVVGDSVAQTLQPSFLATADDLTAHGVPSTVRRFWTVPGFGLTADFRGRLDWASANHSEVSVPPPGLYDSWETDLLAATTEVRPDLVLVLAGAWDAIPRQVGWQWLRPGTPEWRRFYIARVDAANRAFGATGALVVWLRYPCIRNPLQTGRIAMVNEMIAQAASLRPGKVTVLPFQRAACPHGRYQQDYVSPRTGAPTPLRLGDGVHFDFFGAVDRVAPWMATRLAALARA